MVVGGIFGSSKVWWGRDIFGCVRGSNDWWGYLGCMDWCWDRVEILLRFSMVIKVVKGLRRNVRVG